MGKTRRVIGALSCCAAAGLAAAPAVDAQTVDWSLGASASAGLFVGDGSDFLDAGLGLDVVAVRRVASHVQVRAEGMLVFLDEQSGPGETAGNRLVVLGLGPELTASLGVVAPYARGFLGVAANSQIRSGSSLDEVTTWASALGGGVGLRISLGAPLSLDLGGDLVRLGELDFARTSQSAPTNPEDPFLLRLRLGLHLELD